MFPRYASSPAPTPWRQKSGRRRAGIGRTPARGTRTGCNGVSGGIVPHSQDARAPTDGEVDGQRDGKYAQRRLDQADARDLSSRVSSVITCGGMRGASTIIVARYAVSTARNHDLGFIRNVCRQSANLRVEIPCHTGWVARPTPPNYDVPAPADPTASGDSIEGLLRVSRDSKTSILIRIDCRYPVL